MRIAICDDEKAYREDLLRYCRQVLSDVDTEYQCFSSGEDLLSSGSEFDFLFLDIEMSGMDGIHTKNILEKNRSQTRIIFTTSHEERMIDAFGEKVIGFITKPFQKSAFDAISEKMKIINNTRKIEWDDAGKHYVISADTICYIEVQDKYTQLVTDTDKYLIRRPLKEWEKELPTNTFCKINRSHLVNLKLFDKMKNYIKLNNEKTIRLSRKDKAAIEEKYKTYIREKAGAI